MKTCITYYGGKQNLLPKLLASLPEKFDGYCEPFAGGLALFFAKKPSKFEIINDTNSMVVNFYEVVKNDFDNLKKKIEATLFSRATYKVALTIYRMPHLFNKLQQAWSFYVTTQCGFSAQVGSFGFDRKGKRVLAFNNKKMKFDNSFSKRLENTLLENKKACDVIRTFDSEEVLFYCDPPYVSDGSTPKINQGHYAGYSLEDYTSLLDTLVNIKGKFLLSSYPSKLLDTYIKKHGLYTKSFDKPLSARKSVKGKPRGRKTEILTANYKI